MKLDTSKFKNDSTNNTGVKEAYDSLLRQFEDLIRSKEFEQILQKELEQHFRSSEVPYEISLEVSYSGEYIIFRSKVYVVTDLISGVYTTIPTKNYKAPPIGWEHYLVEANDLFKQEINRDNDDLAVKTTRPPVLMNEGETFMYYNILGRIYLE